MWETLAMRDFLDAPNESPLATLLVEEVLALCDRLPPQTARIFRMSREEGIANDEIARRLGISTRTVENQISRALSELRKLVTLILFFF